VEKRTIFLLLLVLGTAFWGISFSVTKLAIQDYSPSTFLFYRFLAATLVLSLIFLRYLRKTDWHSVKIGVGLAIPLLFNTYLQTLGIKHTSASQCAFVAGICVVIIPVLKLIVYRTAVPLKVWIAALVALSGLFIITVKDDLTIGIGDLYTLTGAIGFAFYLLQVEKHSKRENLIYTIVPMFGTCTVITLAIALLDTNAEWQPGNNTFWQGIAFCALFSTAYMYTISNISQRYISAERVSIIYLFEPTFGAVAAFYMLGEVLTWRILTGGSVIFIATMISELNYSHSLSRIKRQYGIS
jgi:drug/metabolite transporter (DMT)-like permease